MMWYGGWGPGGWFLLLVTMLLFWALVVAAGVALVRRLSAPPRGRQAAPPWGPVIRDGAAGGRKSCSPSGWRAGRSTRRSTNAVSRCCGNTGDGPARRGQGRGRRRGAAGDRRRVHSFAGLPGPTS
ncbi:hypothetical protein BX260_0132 [Streptomyces sp. 5112.2]|nr:hypothetical protein BX260_0132 [Streptomyces sp. 5112.2]